MRDLAVRAALPRPLRTLALCAGYDGLGLGLELALGRGGYRPVCAVEVEAYPAAVLVARQQDGSLPPFPLWADVTTFDGRPWRGVVDAITAGYPCQPWSLAGKRLGAADPRHLWPHVARVVAEVQPALVFLENVANHLRLGFPDVGADLQQLGYRFAAGLFSAAEAGAPHRRERLFVLAYASSHRIRHRRNAPIAAGVGGHDGISGANGAELAYRAASRPDAEWRELTHDGFTWHNPDGRGGAGATVADAEGRGEGRPTRNRPAARAGAGRGRPIMEHTTARGRGERGQPSWGTGQPDRAVAPVEHADRRGCGPGARREGRWPPGQRTDERAAFPPGPADHAGWAAVLDRWPDLAPALPQSGFRQLADGPAFRLDRLAALGNGVVPVVAATAFRHLWGELMAGEQDARTVRRALGTAGQEGAA